MIYFVVLLSLSLLLNILGGILIRRYQKMAEEIRGEIDNLLRKL